MTATVNQVTITMITSNTYDALSTSIGVMAILFLVILLIHKELIRTIDSPQSGSWMQVFNIAIVPLFLAFGLIIISRLISLLGF
jgi:hypothetical protein